MEYDLVHLFGPMKLHCKCGKTKFEVNVTPDGVRLICAAKNCRMDFLTNFGPRILERVLKTVSEKFLS